jgi:hypothetical protein
VSALLDERWKWHELRTADSLDVTYVRGACRHLDVTAVVSDGAVVAQLCLTCDQQLPAEWQG